MTFLKERPEARFGEIWVIFGFPGPGGHLDGVAFHMTGDPRYLELAKAGVDFIRANMIDRKGAGMFSGRQFPNGQWGPTVGFRNVQELAYGLVGLSLYY